MTRPQGPQDVNDFHRYDDVDVKADSHHHTLGPGQYQAAPGNHIHDGISAPLGGVYTAVQDNEAPVPPRAALNFNESLTVNDGQVDVLDNAANNSSDVIIRAHNNSDVDLTPAALHHTLGTGANQAAAGNHSHSTLATNARVDDLETLYWTDI